MTRTGVGTNRYAYSFNDPVNLSDPNGHQSAATFKFFESSTMRDIQGLLSSGRSTANAALATARATPHALADAATSVRTMAARTAEAMPTPNEISYSLGYSDGSWFATGQSDFRIREVPNDLGETGVPGNVGFGAGLMLEHAEQAAIEQIADGAANADLAKALAGKAPAVVALAGEIISQMGGGITTRDAFELAGSTVVGAILTKGGAVVGTLASPGYGTMAGGAAGAYMGGEFGKSYGAGLYDGLKGKGYFENSSSGGGSEPGGGPTRVVPVDPNLGPLSSGGVY